MTTATIALMVILGLFEGYSAELIEAGHSEVISLDIESDCFNIVYSISGNATSINEVLANERVVEILSSTEYPAEDREWLESQLRTELAVRNGSFLSREGTQVQLDRQLTRIENDYWGEYVIAASSEYELREAGYRLYNIEIYDLYGEKQADLGANINSMIVSPAGDLLVTQDGGRDTAFPFGDRLIFTLQWFNGESATYEIVDPAAFSANSHAVSRDGTTIVYNTFDIHDYSESNLYVSNNELDIQEVIPVKGVITNIAVSQDNRFVAFSDSHNRLSGVVSLEDNRILYTTRFGRGTPRFSASSEYCVLQGAHRENPSFIVNLQDGTTSSYDGELLHRYGVYHNGEWYISNDKKIISIGNSIIVDNVIVYRDQNYRQCVTSPSGCFAVIEGTYGYGYDTYSIAVIDKTNEVN